MFRLQKLLTVQESLAKRWMCPTGYFLVGIIKRNMNSAETGAHSWWELSSDWREEDQCVKATSTVLSQKCRHIKKNPILFIRKLFFCFQPKKYNFLYPVHNQSHTLPGDLVLCARRKAYFPYKVTSNKPKPEEWRDRQLVKLPTSNATHTLGPLVYLSLIQFNPLA